MRLRAALPENRALPGTAWVEDETELDPATDAPRVVAGPFPCYGKADSGDARAHGNPERFPTLPFGDHPYGTYRIGHIEKDKPPAATFGPWCFHLEPVGGDALKAKLNGRVGLCAHCGVRHPDGTLRATDGCLRLPDEAGEAFAPLLVTGDEYICGK